MKKPMLSLTGNLNDLVRKDYIYEPKLDGVRCLLVKSGESITLINRNNRDITNRYPELQDASGIKAESCLLDGEIIVYNDRGMPDFHLLMKRDQLSNPRNIEQAQYDLPAIFVVFDVLEADGHSFTGLPLSERKKKLDKILSDSGNIQKIYSTPDGIKLWDFAMQNHLEGVVAKDRKSEYLSGTRTDHWLKIKNFQTQDCIIVGWSSGVREISSLALAAYEKEKLKFIGKVGTGFNNEFLKHLLPRLKKIKISKAPLQVPSRYTGLNWVQPILVCEVRYLEFGSEGMMRNPSFIRMRPDKPATECIIERPAMRKNSPIRNKKFIGHA
jgi:bifunctional non-homologous end joining protein LigD